MKKYCSAYVFLFLAQFCCGALQIYEVNENMDVHKCVAMILQRTVFVNVTAVTLINVNVSLAKKLHSLLDHPVKFSSRSFYWPNNTLYNDVYVIQCSDMFMFAYGLDLVRRDPFWNPRAKFVIIFEEIEDFLEDISDSLIYNHVYDVALVTYDGEDEDVVVYTFGLEHDECDRPGFSVLQLLSRCSQIHNYEKIFVASRKTSLRGCHVKFASHDYWPFVSFSKKDAVEDYLLNMIQMYEDITVDVINFGKSEAFGSRLDNFTYTGLLHEIELDKVEGAVGGYVLTFNRMFNLDFIDPYMVDYDKIVIARGKLTNKWNGLLIQLGVITVCIILGTFCVFCVIVILMGIFRRGQRDASRDVLIVWGYFMGNISQKLHSKSGLPYRIVLINILFYVFIISVATQAGLLSATTKPVRGYQPDNVEEVISNYQLILGPSQYDYLQSNPAVDLTNAKTSCKSTLDCMMQIVTNADERLFTVASDIYHESYIWKFADENGELKIHTIKDSLRMLLQTMYIRRGSSLAEPFNRLLMRARSGGLIQHFVDVINNKERLIYKFHAKIKKPQSLKGLKGVFMVLITGYCISSILLLLEYLHHRMGKVAQYTR